MPKGIVIKPIPGYAPGQEVELTDKRRFDALVQARYLTPLHSDAAAVALQKQLGDLQERFSLAVHTAAELIAPSKMADFVAVIDNPDLLEPLLSVDLKDTAIAAIQERLAALDD